jgi:hypothetical protein
VANEVRVQDGDVLHVHDCLSTIAGSRQVQGAASRTLANEGLLAQSALRRTLTVRPAVEFGGEANRVPIGADRALKTFQPCLFLGIVHECIFPFPQLQRARFDGNEAACWCARC